MVNEKALYTLDPNPQGRRVVLLLHGLGADGESWGYQFPVLIEAGLRPVAPDLPGFGKSPPPAEERWTIRGTAARIAMLLDHLGTGAADVVGLSLGGTIAQQLALDYPDKIRKLVLVSTFACLRPRQPRELVYLMRRYMVVNLRGARAQAESVASRVFPHDEQAEMRRLLVEKITQANPVVYRAAMRELAVLNNRRKLERIQLPTLVVTGLEDTTVPLRNQEELARGIPGAKQVKIQGANHGVCIDKPAEFNRVLMDFLLA